MRVLVVGAGGLGCEVLKNLACCSASCDIEIVDFDTIEISNLNRQFMYAEADVGQSKALISAKWLSCRFRSYPGSIVGRNSRLEHLPSEYFSTFHIIFSCLDDLSARMWLNRVLVELAGAGVVIPLVDGGTEGYLGHAALVIPGLTACIDCLSPLFRMENRPLCTLTGSCSSLEDCIEWAVEKCREEAQEGLKAESMEVMIMTLAKSKAIQAGIENDSLSLDLVSSLLARIVPAISSSNSVIAGIMTSVGIKLLSGTPWSSNSSNFWNFCGESGVNLHALVINRAADCPTCREPEIRKD